MNGLRFHVHIIPVFPSVGKHLKGEHALIDEYFDRLVDRWCEAVPRTMKPRMILLANSAIGWRMQLYFGTLGRNIAGLFSRVKDETQMDLTLREGSEQIDDGLARLARFLKEQVALIARLDARGRSIRFCSALFLMMLSVLGVVATGSGGMAVTASSLCMLWLSTAVESDYRPISRGIRQTYLAGTLLRTGAIGLMMLIADDGYDFKTLEEPIKQAIRRNHPIHPDDNKAIEYMNISEMFEMISNLFLGISLLAGFVGFGTLLAGIIGVGNIMWVIVKERTTEIGIRRALGAKPRDIIVQILSEGVVLTFIAGVAGICFAVGVLGGVNYLMTMQGNPAGFQLSFGMAVGITVVFAVLGTAAGIIPAVKAMRIKPIEAINDK